MDDLHALSTRPQQQLDDALVAACRSIGVDNGRTASGEAAKRLALALIDQGADPNQTDLRRRTPIHWAAESGSAALVTALLDACAWIDVQDSQKETALYLSIQAGALSCMRALLQRGANTHIGNLELKTPLHCAAGSGHTNTCVELIKHGARLDVVDKMGRTALDCALNIDHEPTALVLIAYGAVAPKFKEVPVSLFQLPALHAAARAGLNDRVVELLDQGTDPCAKHLGKSAIDEAVMAGKKQTAAVIQAWQAGRAIDEVLQSHAGPKGLR